MSQRTVLDEKKYRVLIFDFDGPIAEYKGVDPVFDQDQEGGPESTATSCLDKINRIIENNCANGTDWVSRLNEKGIDTADRALLKLISGCVYVSTRRKYVVYTWVGKYLPEFARRRIPLAICTNNCMEMLAFALGDLLGCFSVLVTCNLLLEEGMNLKPSPDGILMACDVLKTDPADVLLVGDTAEDVIACMQAGVDCALSGWGRKILPLDKILCMNRRGWGQIKVGKSKVFTLSEPEEILSCI